MGGQIQAFSESIDDVLTAVQETPRGRWFLQAYAERLKSGDTAHILNAIAKLESNLERMTQSGASAELLSKARLAITEARKEIAKLEPKTSELSSEAKLFSYLAEQSRKAFSGAVENPGLGQSVERALRLVADLDQDLNGQQSEFVAPPKPAPSYFKQDEEIFEPAPPKAAPVAAVKKVADVPEPPSKGAKLTIRKLKVEPTEPAPVVAAEPALEPEKVEAANPAESFAPATVEEPSRIAIIRRKSDEMIAVPLLDEEPSSQTEQEVTAA